MSYEVPIEAASRRARTRAVVKKAHTSLPETRRFVAFLALAEALHYGKAAARLGMSQSPLSRLIIGLERDLETELFKRNRREVRLTAAGKTFQSSAQAIIHAVEDAALEARRKHVS